MVKFVIVHVDDSINLISKEHEWIIDFTILFHVTPLGELWLETNTSH